MRKRHRCNHYTGSGHAGGIRTVLRPVSCASTNTNRPTRTSCRGVSSTARGSFGDRLRLAVAWTDCRSRCPSSSDLQGSLLPAPVSVAPRCGERLRRALAADASRRVRCKPVCPHPSESRILPQCPCAIVDTSLSSGLKVPWHPISREMISSDRWACCGYFQVTSIAKK